MQLHSIVSWKRPKLKKEKRVPNEAGQRKGFGTGYRQGVCVAAVARTGDGDGMVQRTTELGEKGARRIRDRRGELVWSAK